VEGGLVEETFSGDEPMKEADRERKRMRGILDSS
jgi:hypothetical protein